MHHEIEEHDTPRPIGPTFAADRAGIDTEGEHVILVVELSVEDGAPAPEVAIGAPIEDVRRLLAHFDATGGK